MSSSNSEVERTKSQTDWTAKDTPENNLGGSIGVRKHSCKRGQSLPPPFPLCPFPCLSILAPSTLPFLLCCKVDPLNTARGSVGALPQWEPRPLSQVKYILSYETCPVATIFGSFCAKLNVVNEANLACIHIPGEGKAPVLADACGRPWGSGRHDEVSPNSHKMAEVHREISQHLVGQSATEQSMTGKAHLLKSVKSLCHAPDCQEVT